MTKLSTSAKEAVIKKALSRDGKSIKDIAFSHNIGYSTLQKWLREYQNDVIMVESSKETSNQKLTSSERFQHLIATASFDAEATGIYCRKHGLFSFQLKQWKDEFMTQRNDVKKQAENSELKSLRAENKQLKQEVRRKDSALAEAAALLILKKKAGLIWGEVEDD